MNSFREEEDHFFASSGQDRRRKKIAFWKSFACTMYFLIGTSIICICAFFLQESPVGFKEVFDTCVEDDLRRLPKGYRSSLSNPESGLSSFFSFETDSRQRNFYTPDGVLYPPPPTYEIYNYTGTNVYLVYQCRNNNNSQVAAIGYREDNPDFAHAPTTFYSYLFSNSQSGGTFTFDNGTTAVLMSTLPQLENNADFSSLALWGLVVCILLFALPLFLCILPRAFYALFSEKWNLF